MLLLKKRLVFGLRGVGDALHVVLASNIYKDRYRKSELLLHLIENATASELDTPKPPAGRPIILAAQQGLEDVTQALLRKCASFVAPEDEHNENCLIIASRCGCEGVIQTLLSEGVDINSPGRRYGNGLQVASERGHDKIVQVLIDVEYCCTLLASSHRFSNAFFSSAINSLVACDDSGISLYTERS